MKICPYHFSLLSELMLDSPLHWKKIHATNNFSKSFYKSFYALKADSYIRHSRVIWLKVN